MNWFDRLTGLISEPVPAERLLKAPGAYAIVPDVLTVSVEEHDLRLDYRPDVKARRFALPGRTCRSYLTHGLAETGQREIMFVFAPGDATFTSAREQQVMDVLHLIYELVREGGIVHPGDITVFGEQAPFGLSHGGIAYLDPVDGPGPPVRTEALLALVLRPEECEAANIAGVHRVAAWLGDAYRIFPYPKFSDLSRPSAIPAYLSETVLAKLQTLRVTRNAGVFLRDKTLTLRLTGDLTGHLRNAFAAVEGNPVFSILTGHVSDADARLVWVPTASGDPAGICVREPITTFAGGFIVLIGDQTTDSAAVQEDGFMVMLRPESWSALRHAAESRTDLEMPMSGDENRFVRRFRLEWTG